MKNLTSLMKSVITASVLTALVLGSAYAGGGNGAGNSGNTLVVDGKMVLLDLVEAGVHKAPYVYENSRSKDPVDIRFVESANTVFTNLNFPVAAKKVLIEKLLEFPAGQRDLLVATAPLYSWRWVPGALVEIKGIESPLDLSKEKVFQAAYRRDSSILINQQIWNLLDVYHQGALLMHEMVSSALRPQRLANGTFLQRSWDGRQIIGDSFMNNIGRDLRNYTRNGKSVLTLFDAKPGTEEAYALSTLRGVSGVGTGRIGGSNITSVMGASTIIVTSPGQTDWRNNFMFGSLEHYDNGSKTHIVEQACQTIMSRGGKGTISSSMLNVTYSLEDYETKDGVTKYVKPAFTMIKGMDLAIGQKEFYPGSLNLNYSSKEACIQDLPKKIDVVRKGLR